MDGPEKKKRKQRVSWKPGEKEAMAALREQYSTMSLREFQQVIFYSFLFLFLFILVLSTLQTTRLTRYRHITPTDLPRIWG